MAVKSTKNHDTLTLTLDNGDLTKFEDAFKKWSFKDHQSFLRFAVSIFLLNEGNSFSIKMDNNQTDVVPVKDLLKNHEGE